jgi:hypothetical protein
LTSTKTPTKITTTTGTTKQRQRIYLISQKWLEKKFQKKNLKYRLRGNNYEACTAVACCFPNILDVMVLKIYKNVVR